MKTVLFYLVVMTMTAAQSPQQITPDAPKILTLELSAPEVLKTGSEQACILKITNRSRHLVLVTAISFPDNSRMKGISLMQRVYGGIFKEVDKDAYCYNSMMQQESHLPFCYGVLLPGQKRTVSFSWLAFRESERVSVHYIASQQPYNGSIASQAPLKLYMAASKQEPSTKYLPASKEMLQAFSEKSRLYGGDGPFAWNLHVLLPSFYQLPANVVSHSVDFRQDIAFSSNDAFEAAASMMESDQFKLHYLPHNKCYLVEPNDKKHLCWLLHAPMQEGFGSFLPHDASVIIELLENPLNAKLRVGDRQEGFGPGGRKADYKFWNKWEVHYGDGMYTNGEFIEVKKDQWRPLLEQIAEKNGSIKKVFYYFQSYYYQLTFEK